MTAKVLVPLAREFEETEAIAVVDVLRRAGVEVVVAGLEPGPVESTHGVVLVPDVLLEEVVEDTFDAVVLPGGLGGTERLRQSQLVRQVLDRANDRGKIIAAICAAPTVLEAQGLLSGKRATCHGSMVDKLDSATFLDEPVVVDGLVVTSRGVGTALAFGLELVSILVSQEQAEQIATAIHFRR